MEKQTLPSLIAIVLVLTATAGIIGIRRFIQQAPSARIRIGIVQTASHPALDAARMGFIEHLNKEIGDDIIFTVQNAQGSIADATAIAQNFAADKQITGFFAIGTPALQAVASAEKDRPIIFAAATDPVLLDLTAANVTGCTDLLDANDVISTLRTLLPHVTTVAILSNPAEINARMMAKQLEAALKNNGIRPVHVGFSNEADIASATAAACNKAQAIIAPTDNTVASAIQLVATQARKAQTPLIVSDNLLVKDGALAGCGVDYHENGCQAGKIAHDIFVEGKKPSTVPVKKIEHPQVAINQEVMTALKLELPKVFENKVELVTTTSKGENHD